MTLIQIWNSRPAWTTLSALRKPPGLAYRLLKYERLLDVEIATIEKARIEMITKAAGAEPGTEVTLGQGPELDAFVKEFVAFLDTDSELQPFDLDMDGLMAALDSQAGNTLAESDLAALEPFFTQPAELPVGAAFRESLRA